jgi:23S rRNA (cytidine1920-2'-O)/16S rRNA (cytidine1409-2'-O)-methyltransferase
MAGEPYVSRGGEKLAAALNCFGLDPSGATCADLGSHVGGFVDCLLRRGVARVFAIDTCYGTLAWKLRKDDRVVVLERTNAMHVELPEPVDLVTIDVGWTPQAKILPHVATLLSPSGRVLTLIKPHYEAPRDQLVEGVLPDEHLEEAVDRVVNMIKGMGWQIDGTCDSPIRGHGGNRELFALLDRKGSDST